MHKFIGSEAASKFQIKTHNGWEDLSLIHKTIPYKVTTIKTESNTLRCADEHLLVNGKGEEVFTKELTVGDSLLTYSGVDTITSVDKSDTEEIMFDAELAVGSERLYYTNGFLSHNTTTYCIVALHYCMFNKDKKILILANKKETALEIISRVKLGYELMPKWLVPGCKEANKSRIIFTNGCSIEGCATTPDAARGKSASFLVIDECLTANNNVVVRNKKTNEIETISLETLHESDKYR